MGNINCASSGRSRKALGAMARLRKGLLRDMSGGEEIAPRVLSRELKTLAAFGLIERTEYRMVPPKVEYSLTTLGQSLLPTIAQMIDWGRQHLLSDSAPVLH